MGFSSFRFLKMCLKIWKLRVFCKIGHKEKTFWILLLNWMVRSLGVGFKLVRKRVSVLKLSRVK